MRLAAGMEMNQLIRILLILSKETNFLPISRKQIKKIKAKNHKLSKAKKHRKFNSLKRKRRKKVTKDQTY